MVKTWHPMTSEALRGGVLSGERVNYFEMNYTVKIRRDKCSGIWYVLSPLRKKKIKNNAD